MNDTLVQYECSYNLYYIYIDMVKIMVRSVLWGI